MYPKVTVITGASSGIGEAIARQFARPGAQLALAARGLKALETVAKQCWQKGAEVIVVPTDISKIADIEQLAARAAEAFGQIDVWVNNAGIISYGSFLSIKPEDFQRVIDVNVLGCANGSRAALSQFSRQTSGGTLINISSALGTFSIPYASAYVTSKYAIRGLSASLRQELLAEKAEHIHVCTILPATIDTPIYQQAANSSGRQVRALPPAYPAAIVARAAWRLIEKPRAEVIVGYAARFPAFLSGIAPGLTEKIIAHYGSGLSFKKQPSGDTKSNMYESRATATISGGWPTWQERAGKIVGVAAIVAGVWWFMTKRNNKEKKK